MKTDYSYQGRLVKDSVDSLLENQTHLLCAAPGAGKTQMAFEIIKKMRTHGVKKTLVLCHGQNILREQWQERSLDHKFLSQNLRPVKNRQGKKINKKAEVYFSLPHKLLGSRVKKLSDIDMVVVDEAHHFFLADMVKKIIGALKPKYQLLLTGTPSRLLADGYENYSGLTVSEMLDYRAAANPKISLYSSGYNHSFRDLNKDLQINRFTKKSTIGTLDLLIKKEGKLTLFDKTMVACQNRKQAVWARNYLKKLGINTMLCISPESTPLERRETGHTYLWRRFDVEENLEPFLDGKYQCAVVVNKGIIGFDYPQLKNIIDLSCSLNPDRIFQLLCRSVRPGEDKRFIKVGSPALMPVYYYVMSYVSAMSLPEYYYRVHHNKDKRVSLNGLVAPLPIELRKKLEADSTGGAFMGLGAYDLPPVASFKEIRDGIKSGEYANTDFEWIKKSLGIKSPKTDRLVEDCIARARAMEPSEYIKKYKIEYRWLKRVMGGAYKVAETIWGITIANSMKKPVVFWTMDEAIRALKNGKFKNRHELKIKNNSLYKFLLKKNRKVLNKFIPTRHKFKWSKETAVSEASLYRTFKEFRNSSWGAVNFLEKNYPDDLKKIRQSFISKHLTGRQRILSGIEGIK